MSRSIHTTRRDLKETKRFCYSQNNAEHRDAQLKRLREQLSKKRHIKKQVLRERHRPAAPVPLPIETSSIPICILDEGKFIHYPATAADIQCVMRLLPMGVLDGISSIDMCLGAEYQTDSSEQFKPDPDPFVGRHGYEMLPGVFQGKCLGVYLSHRARICVFAYVYDSAMPDRQMWEVYLRLHMLSTFVHEVAHHHDRMTRIGRGRWLADTTEKQEIYAEKLQHEWVQRYVIPYLEKTYPEPLKALDAWIRHHGGVSISLSLLAGDPRSTAKGGLIKWIDSVSGALEILAADVAKGEPLTSTRLTFAKQLHYGENYAESLEIVSRVLAEHPDNLEALTLEADIYEHQEKYDEAQSLAEKVISIDETYMDAWKVLIYVRQARQDWDKLLVAATQALELQVGSRGWAFLLTQRALARLELGDFEGVEADIERLLQGGGRYCLLQASKLQKEMRSRLGQSEEER